MTRKLLLVLSCLIIGGCAESIPQSFRDDMAALEMLLRQDPVKSATIAAEQGDVRLLGIAGFAVDIPGVEHPISDCEAIYDKLTIVKGTSDIVWDKKHHALIEDARKYAGRYNAYIVSHKNFRLPNKCTQA